MKHAHEMSAAIAGLIRKGLQVQVNVQVVHAFDDPSKKVPRKWGRSMSVIPFFLSCRQKEFRYQCVRKMIRI
jgi:hypothetical protein